VFKLWAIFLFEKYENSAQLLKVSIVLFTFYADIVTDRHTEQGRRNNTTKDNICFIAGGQVTLSK